ncbi:hypothetical protein KEM56_007708 [Ascosphaera pollenicola]|nr:hypothetical protein KEM56_007708 [Ascosphaera pollenicola]
MSLPSSRSSSDHAHRYVSRDELERTMELEAKKDRDRVTFFEVPPQVIDDLCSNDNARTISSFNQIEQRITMRNLSLEHERATYCIEKMVLAAFRRSETSRAMAPCGGATAPYLQCQWVSGERPDAAWQLRPEIHDAEHIHRTKEFSSEPVCTPGKAKEMKLVAIADGMAEEIAMGSSDSDSPSQRAPLREIATDGVL